MFIPVLITSVAGVCTAIVKWPLSRSHRSVNAVGLGVRLIIYLIRRHPTGPVLRGRTAIIVK